MIRLKCDNAYVTEATQLRMAHEVLGRGKFFWENGAAASQERQLLPIARFIEGGNGYGAMAGHLSLTPLVIGIWATRPPGKAYSKASGRASRKGASTPDRREPVLGPDNLSASFHRSRSARLARGG